MLLTGTDVGPRLHEPQDHIHLAECVLRNIHHVLTEFVFCLVDARCIEEDNLPVFICIHSLDPISRGLRFFRCDRDLLSDQVVHQRGLTNVRASDQCHKTRFISLFHEISLILLYVSLPYRIAPASTLRSGRCWTCATGT